PALPDGLLAAFCATIMSAGCAGEPACCICQASALRAAIPSAATPAYSDFLGFFIGSGDGGKEKPGVILTQPFAVRRRLCPAADRSRCRGWPAHPPFHCRHGRRSEERRVGKECNSRWGLSGVE